MSMNASAIWAALDEMHGGNDSCSYGYLTGAAIGLMGKGENRKYHVLEMKKLEKRGLEIMAEKEAAQ